MNYAEKSVLVVAWIASLIFSTLAFTFYNSGETPTANLSWVISVGFFSLMLFIVIDNEPKLSTRVTYA